MKGNSLHENFWEIITDGILIDFIHWFIQLNMNLNCCAFIYPTNQPQSICVHLMIFTI
uniref:Uncharacterized protein n=1 Tax=Tetranychus urticae TaxID=32264 RepID=T1L2W3_TETUR